MTALFWVGGVLLVLTALPAAIFFGLHLATGEPVPLSLIHISEPTRPY